MLKNRKTLSQCIPRDRVLSTKECNSSNTSKNNIEKFSPMVSEIISQVFMKAQISHSVKRCCACDYFGWMVAVCEIMYKSRLFLCRILKRTANFSVFGCCSYEGYQNGLKLGYFVYLMVTTMYVNLCFTFLSTQVTSNQRH